MITRDPPTWQAELADTVREPLELLKELEISPVALPDPAATTPSFPLRVTRSFVRRMHKGDPGDPLLRQVLPLKVEERSIPGFALDPVGDLPAMARPGLLHKYEGRILLITTGACAVHCRFCFRRNFPYPDAHAARARWQTALDYIAADETINEVVLSGGDPLTLTDEKLAELVQKLTALSHLKRLRLHTRLPIVLPSRVDDRLLSWLNTAGLQTVFVVHVNHPNELDQEVYEALTRLTGAGARLFNQSVLLRGINDSAETLAALSEGLFGFGVLPYYLHQLDLVQGAAHFAVEDDRAMKLVETLRSRLPGYLVPKLVREKAGAPYKLLMG